MDANSYSINSRMCRFLQIKLMAKTGKMDWFKNCQHWIAGHEVKWNKHLANCAL